jgi:predicted metal-binding membrane protein
VAEASNQEVARPARLSAARLSVALAAPVAVAVAAWLYLAAAMPSMSGAADMAGLLCRAMPMQSAPLGSSRLLALAAMWVVMMAAMMLPTALPMVVTYARLRAAGPETAHAAADVALFVVGYIATWSAFSIAATALQGLLTEFAYLSPMTMTLASAPVAGAVLVAAGLYQWLPWKDACLGRCRSPIGFLMTAWRDGPGGALAMGWRHGLFCVGCCWALMAVLFVTGVMNPFWMVVLTGYMLAEKIAPGGAVLAKAVGAALIGAGLWMMLA